MSFVWSPAALEQLHRLYVEEGRSAAEVARALGGAVTRNAVLGKVQRTGWTKRPRAEAAKPQKPAPPQRTPPAIGKVRKPGPFLRDLPLPRLREIAVVGLPRPWTERGEGECAFPIGEPARADEQLSCCAPTRGGSYCPAHRALMRVEGAVLTPKDQDAIVEIARRAA